MSKTFVDVTAETSAADARSSRVRRWFAGPPGPIFTMLVMFNAGLTLVAYAGPGAYMLIWLAAAAGWAGLGLAFAAKAGLSLAIGPAWSRPSGTARDGLRWLAVPAVVAVTAGLVLTAVPTRVGLTIASPAMLEFAADASAPAPTRVGPYQVERAERLPNGGARFVIAGTGFLNDSGFAYSPYVAPPNLGEDHYQQLRGAWYLWEQNW